ncbi:MAG TPA: hypothetical protein VMF89_08035, partial [Polyangiales bacterium]|nr:hypothetical protein [Polyangiales bacterium]
MKIKHYRAADMRTALRQVRDAQGPDAVILSTRRVPGGVEVEAAVDYDGEDAATEQLAADSGLVDTYGAERRQAQAQAPANVSQAAPARTAQHDPALFGSASKSQSQQQARRAAAVERNAPANEYMSERAELTRQFAAQSTQPRAQQTNRYIANDPDDSGQRYASTERAPASRASTNERARHASEAQASSNARFAVEAEPVRDVDL